MARFKAKVGHPRLPVWNAPSSLIISYQGTYDFSLYCSDPLGGVLTFSLVSGVGSVAPDGTYTPDVDGTVVVRATNMIGSSDTTCTVDVIGNEPRVWTIADTPYNLGNVEVRTTTTDIDLLPLTTDPDGGFTDVFSVVSQTRNGVAGSYGITIDQTMGVLTLPANLTAGDSYSVGVTLSDGIAAPVNRTFGFTVQAAPIPQTETNVALWDANSAAWQLPAITGTVVGSSQVTLGLSDGGRSCMRVRMYGNVQGQVGVYPDTAYYLPARAGGILRYRWAMRYDSAWSWGANESAKIKAARITAPTELFTIYLANYGFYLAPVDEVNHENVYLFYDMKPQTNPTVASWHNYRIELKQQSSIGASDGFFKFYLDDVLITQQQNIRYYGSEMSADWRVSWGAMMSWPYPQLNGTASDGGYIYVDDVSLTYQAGS